MANPDNIKMDMHCLLICMASESSVHSTRPTILNRAT
jgi:hypothetical protein